MRPGVSPGLTDVRVCGRGLGDAALVVDDQLRAAGPGNRVVAVGEVARDVDVEGPLDEERHEVAGVVEVAVDQDIVVLGLELVGADGVGEPLMFRLPRMWAPWSTVVIVPPVTLTFLSNVAPAGAA